ncbi:Oligopeptide transport system permease protein OppC (TC 3.A.1.5.1) [Halorubrum sp. DM2]|uniref:ABC transporter permease n=1 Tax=unclassified Halorubrum TaxID=2642239 RepID=UPI0003DC5287|nr:MULTISPECIES: ABC transporter permease [unclassified Halorubrum]CDK38576.1 ABC-type dipeptide/oligopeptide/nickel transport system, permease component [Halorubrum sp. AJ67]VTT85782.1 Oligopeptide transport system permease protein OppC (TC 3.A.1.5.1) [Halorubrum sp. DM2]
MPTDANDDATSAELGWRAEASTEEISRRDRFAEFYRRSIREPAVVAWSDGRTRAGIVILSGYLLMALVDVFGLWRDASPNQSSERLLLPFQSLQYPLGTTQSGTDLLALIIDSTPFILLMVLAGGVWATGLALFVGTVSGYKGGRVDTVITSISDFFMAIPGLPLVIVLAIAINPQNPLLLGVILTINYWAGLGRSIRSQVLSIREESYVEASRTMGTGTFRIIRKDVLPNIMPYVMVNFVLAARYTIFASVGLYFIGVLPYSGQNWGVTLNNAYSQGGLFTLDAVHWLMVPMVAIVGLSFGLILLSQGMDRIFNPRVRTRLSGESESIEEPDEETTTGPI